MIFVEPIFRDLQQKPINGYCHICGGELYGDEEWICRDCSGVVKLDREAETLVKQLQRETGMTAKYIVSQIVIQGYDFLEIKEES